MQVEDSASRDWCIDEAVDQHSFTRQLERQFSVFSETPQIFAAKYVRVLPTEQEREREVERERRLIEVRRVDRGER